jgi:hypothetical protein
MRLLRSAKPTPVTRGGDNMFWYSKDQVFNQPRTIFQCLLHTTNCADGHPENSLMVRIRVISDTGVRMKSVRESVLHVI